MASSVLKGKIACLTGGLKGIGYSMAKILVKNGVKGLLVADVDDSVAAEVVSNLEENGTASIKFLHSDLSSTYAADCVLKKTIEEFGQLDILINNAGIISELNYERMIQINYISLLYATMLAMYRYMPKYKGADEGIIVNNASIFGVQPGYSLPVYASCKHAIVGIGRAFGTDYYYNRYKSKVLTICPGYSPTSLTTDISVSKEFDVPLFIKEISQFPWQKTYYCAKCLMDMLENPRNGSIWIIEGEECYQYPYEDRFKVRDAMKEGDKDCK